jgi:hypothetical protein
VKNKRLFLTQFITALLIVIAFIAEAAFALPKNETRIDSSHNPDLDGWIIESPDSYWTNEELAMVHLALSNSVTALDDAGYDGQEMLSGYRFRRQQGEFVDGVNGRIAFVRHNKQEVILSDSAFQRLQGFYIYHELGHIVDKRLGRQLSQRFHEIAGSIAQDGATQTADGYWLNDHAHQDHQEATSDAFAIWVVLRYTDNYKPVFAHTPPTTSYEHIVHSLDMAIKQ